jgi:hypothetical protein
MKAFSRLLLGTVAERVVRAAEQPVITIRPPRELSNRAKDLTREQQTLRSVSSLPGNVCLRSSDGLLIGYKVACQFESRPLRHWVWGVAILQRNQLN